MSTEAGARDSLCLPLDAPGATLELVGGKGASLARLAAAGLPVPPGFHVTTAAYRRFVAENDIEAQILAAAAAATADRPATLDGAERRIGALFAESPMPDAIAEAIGRAYAALGGGELPVAVRSSATAEDLPGMSFAGQQETYLNVSGQAAVVEAVRRCWASLWTARAIGYRARQRVASEGVSIAVVVQELVPADAAGVLFTADPVTGARDRVLINAGWGLGEAVVGGRVTPDTVVVDRGTGTILELRVADKSVMTVPGPDGTRGEPVPADRRGRPVLSPAQASDLARLGTRVEALYARPMDVEWALDDGHLFVLQARPITTLPADAADAGQWNDSWLGDYLWTSGNLGEAIPDVMTPCTWSLVRRFVDDAMAASVLPGRPLVGNIGGRFYMNLSVMATLAAAFGAQRRAAAASEQVFGRLPPGLEVPLIPIPRWRILRAVVPAALRLLIRVRANRRRLPAFLAGAPARCEALRGRIAGVSSAAGLVELWERELAPFVREVNQMLEAAGREGGNALVMVRWELRQLVGDADADALLSGLSAGTSELASLGPLRGLEQLAGGEIDRATFAGRYGHRGPHEFEVSIARPGEDPDWIDAQLAGLRHASVDVAALLARQEHARAAAWARFRARRPGKEAATRRRVARWGAVARNREAARSEVIRAFWALRAFVLRAGALTGRGQDLFFLSIEEILAVLGGDDSSLASIPARRATYERYRALPTYPALIRGRFDPLHWAADPDRRGDLFDPGGGAPMADTISGFPGAAGIVEGPARVLATVEEGDLLRAGEVLVTTVTNVGWTPLFPRAAAIVTDVGAPLSHAAIVARELGIPAVVGCGNATTRLRTGDRVRVDGRRGTVELLPAVAADG